jgi:hypothetical protein
MSSFCLGCGTSLLEGQRFCGNCGRDSSLSADAPRPDPAASFGFPPETSPKAIFSLVCGVLFLFPPAAIVAVVLGHLSLSDIRKSAGKRIGRGLAITGLVLGYVGAALGVVWIVLIAISIPKSMQALRNASASVATKNTAVATIRSLNTAEIAYAQAHPATGYTCSLPDLRKAWGVNEKLVEGYVFTVRGCKAIKPNGPIEKYELVAAPQAQKNGPTYCSSESDEIKVAARGAEQDCWKSGVALSETRVNREE